MAVTLYPYKTGKDPQYDLWNARYNYEKSQAASTRKSKQQAAMQTYKEALRSLTQQGWRGKSQIDNNMLARGVFSSGETSKRQADLAASILDGKSKAMAGYHTTNGEANLAYQNALNQLSFQNQEQIQNAIGRVTKPAGGGGGGGGGRTVPAYSPPPAASFVPTIAPPRAPTGYGQMPSIGQLTAQTSRQPRRPSGAAGGRPMQRL